MYQLKIKCILAPYIFAQKVSLHVYPDVKESTELRKDIHRYLCVPTSLQLTNVRKINIDCSCVTIIDYICFATTSSLCK